MFDSNLEASFKRATRRLQRRGPPVRRGRADAGQSRLPADVVAAVQPLMLQTERPPMKELVELAEQAANEGGHPVPARSTLYQLLRTAPGHLYAVTDLPPHARCTLYNLDDEAVVPGAQLAFCLFSYGGRRAISYGASLPWLDLYQAAGLRGWRPKSRALLESVLEARRI